MLIYLFIALYMSFYQSPYSSIIQNYKYHLLSILIYSF